MKFEVFTAWADENPSKSIKILPGSLPAGLRSVQSSLAELQISEISKIREKCRPDLQNLGNPRKRRGPKIRFSRSKKRKKMFWVRCVVSKSLIPQHVEFSTFLKPSPPNALFEFRDSGQPPNWSIEGKSTNIDKKK